MQTGATLPNVTFQTRVRDDSIGGDNPFRWQEMTTAYYFAGKRVVLFALPDQAARENRFEIAIPSGASIILKHDPAGVIPGLNDFVAEDGTVLHPPVAPVFWGFLFLV